MMDNNTLPDGLVSYGPNTNCTIALCPIDKSALSYRPSLAASGIFLTLFALATIVHIIEGVRWKAWGFMVAMALGCIDEIVGYLGRILLYYNPFSFGGFLINQICITTAPVFFCAAIYVTLSRTICYLDPTISRFNPKLIYWIFISADVTSLSLQAGGGGESSITSGSSKLGENISLAGLSLQVFSLLVFILLATDYLVRFYRLPNRARTSSRFKMYLVFLSLSVVLVLIRCVYRIDELKEGYSGALFHNEGCSMGWRVCSLLLLYSVFTLVILEWECRKHRNKALQSIPRATVVVRSRNKMDLFAGWHSRCHRSIGTTVSGWPRI